MRILVLGGTLFVGRAVVADAIGRGWSVTVFHRGRTGAAPEGVETLLGDRTVPADLAVLAGREWDAVVDTWTGPPRAVRDSARLLAGSAGHYCYVSSRSVYRPPLRSGMTEDAAVLEASPDAGDSDGAGNYGESKAGGELAARREFGAATLIARTGLVLGPHEDVGRLPWWLTRIAAGGDVLAPGPPDLPLQYVDARDLATWLLDAAHSGLTGTFNALSRPGHTTTARLLAACVDATHSTARLHWIAPRTILDAGVAPWTQLPIWVPPGHPFRPMHETNTDRAHAAGLRCRPIEATVADTWDWLCEAGPVGGDVGLDPATEAAVLSSAGATAR